VTVRESGDARFLFFLNGTTDEQRVNVGEGGYDLVSGETISGEVYLAPLGVVILRQGK
jgi:hypothetical protein